MAKAADPAALVAFALAVGGLAPLLYRLPALHSDPGLLTVGVLLPVTVAYGVHAVLRGVPVDPMLPAFVVGFDLLWWAVSAVLYPEQWLAVGHLGVAVPLATHLLALAAVILGLLVWRRSHPRPARVIPPPVTGGVNRAYPAAAIDRSMPGPGGVPRPDYVRPRGQERSELLAAEARHALTDDDPEEVLARFEDAVATQPAGFNHLFPLQSGAAIAVVRQATSWRALGRPEDALKCYEYAYNLFRGAMEEQAGEEDWYARQWAAEALLRLGDLLAELGRTEQARAAWRLLLPSRAGFIWPSLMDWADEAADRLR